MRVRAWVLGVAMAAAGEAGALSRAMWAEFNAIYYVNLRPTAECNVYRTRSLELLKDHSLSPEVLDTRMRALWDEAKAGCLQAALPGRPAVGRKEVDPARAAAPTVTAATATPTPPPRPAPGLPAPTAPREAGTPATAALGNASSAPEARQPAGSGQALSAAPSPADAPSAAGVPSPPAGQEAPPSQPQSPIVAAAGPAGAHHGEQRAGARVNARSAAPAIGPARMAPVLAKPPIDLPSPADLRLEAACAKRNPYAYQVQTADDPCAKLASGRASQAAVETGSGGQTGTRRVGIGVVLLVVVAALGFLGAAVAGWAWWRGRQRPADAGHPERAVATVR